MSTPLNTTFEALGLNPAILKTLAELGYEEPTPIQREAIPLLLEGKDVFGQAATGTGKTAAFALPLVQMLQLGKAIPFGASALVLVPTRELAVQVAEAVHSYGKGSGVSVLPIYGGQEISMQLRHLKRGVDVVVATPGRALDHLRRKTLKLENVSMVILDEADEMLDMGFADDLETILSELPAERQTALFSATLPPRIAAIAGKYLRGAIRLKIKADKSPTGETPKVRQTVYFVTRNQKVAALGRVLDLEAPRSAIIFCRTRTEVDSLTDTLTGLGFKAEPLHGGMSQEQRDRVLKRFKSGTTETLVATDVAARGLHVDKLSHVINYDLPTAPEAYVHRIGRTGRAGQEGVAISFADPRERGLLKNIEKLIGQRLEPAVVPTAADLRVRRLELLKGTLRETLLGGELELYRGVVDSLTAEFDAADVAAAALKMALIATVGEETERPEIVPSPTPERQSRPERPERSERPVRPDRPERSERPVRSEVASNETFVKLFIGAGRLAGIRPGDLVGAIANEAGIESSRIGSIQITDAFSLVQVPADTADGVLTALRNTTLRGKKVKVDRERLGKRTP